MTDRSVLQELFADAGIDCGSWSAADYFAGKRIVKQAVGDGWLNYALGIVILVEWIMGDSEL